MANIKAFKGLRFNTEKAGKIEELVCPPYDIIDEKQREKYIEKNENNIIRLELPKGGEEPYKGANKILREWIKNGILQKEEVPAIYIYEEEFISNNKKAKVKGLICTVKIEEFSKGVILPHEYTLSKAKEDRLKLMKETNSNFSQIYSLYMDEEHKTINRLDKLSEREADIELTDGDNVIHRMWVVTDVEEIQEISKDFENRKLYIADGHHRYETALNYRNYCREKGITKEGDEVDYQMMMLVDMEHKGLVVYPTHRLVRNLKDLDINEVIKECNRYFEVEDKTGIDTMEEELEKLFNKDKKAYGLYKGDNKWVLLTLKDDKVIKELLPEASEATRKLDVTILHTLILEGLFGIDKENMAKQINLTYVKKFEDAIKSVDNKESQCAFIMNKTKVTQIRDVATNGEKMPQKSTYFYPKLITGLVMNELSNN